MSGGGVTYYLEQARQKSNARMIIIDPRYTDTGAGREDEWIPIRPYRCGAGQWSGICLNHREHGRSAVPDKYCVGYDEKPCLPARRKTVTTKPIFWAVVKTVLRRRRSGRRKLPVSRRIALLLAREIGSAKPAYICRGWGHSVMLMEKSPRAPSRCWRS